MKLKPYIGVALMIVGALLLLVCRLTGWQTNAELLIGLTIIVLGFVWHIWSEKGGEKY